MFRIDWLLLWLSHHHLLACVPLLRSLHWLPVKFRVDFKICLLTYKTLSEKQPVYVHSLLATPLPSRSLRSNKGITMSVPRVKTNAGKRSFSSCAPSRWNSSPLSVRSSTSVSTFRKCLKTYLFWPGLSPIDTGMPDDLLTLWNCFIDFAVEHWFGCHTTESGYAGDIGAIEIWLIDWLIEFQQFRLKDNTLSHPIRSVRTLPKTKNKQKEQEQVKLESNVTRPIGRLNRGSEATKTLQYRPVMSNNNPSM